MLRGNYLHRKLEMRGNARRGTWDEKETTNGIVLCCTQKVLSLKDYRYFRVLNFNFSLVTRVHMFSQFHFFLILFFKGHTSQVLDILKFKGDISTMRPNRSSTTEKTQTLACQRFLLWLDINKQQLHIKSLIEE